MSVVEKRIPSAKARYTAFLATLTPGMKQRLALGAALIAEGAISIFLYFGFALPACDADAGHYVCSLYKEWAVRALCVAIVLTVFCWRRPQSLGPLVEAAGASLHWRWAALLGAGAALSFAPLAFSYFGVGFATPVTFAFWTSGALAQIAGAALMTASPGAWSQTAKRLGWGAAVALVIAYFAIDILWYGRHVADLSIFDEPIYWLTIATFEVCATLLSLFDPNVIVDPETHTLGIGDFEVYVWGPCSGIEGFALITSFLLFYIWLFRSALAFPRVWILLPIGVVLSWCLNVIRITGLVWLGAYVSEELSINAFHSHAGWFMFTLLAVSLALVAHLGGWFHRKPATAAEAPAAETSLAARTPFFDDPHAAQIFPFIVFLAAALALATFTETPAVYYPIRFFVVIGALFLFRRYILSLEWRADPIALGAGVLVGVAWLATSPPASAADQSLAEALQPMSSAELALWATTRLAGTIIMAPLVEELFFRGYILRKIDTGGLMRIVAIVASAALFAMLHGRWLAAAAAGVVFGLILLRRGRLSDAILAHAAANAVIALWVLRTGDWSLI